MMRGTPATAAVATNGNRALDIVSEMTREDEKEPDVIPELPENPTEDQIWAYAQSHPTVQRISKVFRGKLIRAEKEES